jgi:diaminopimelate epimerase
MGSGHYGGIGNRQAARLHIVELGHSFVDRMPYQAGSSAQRIRIEIWERGAGYTLASGSSSCAAAAASVRLGLCSREVTVLMPGGALQVEVRADGSVTLLGPVRKIAEGTLSPEVFEDAR